MKVAPWPWRINLGLNTRRRAVDHLRRFVRAPCTPLARGGLRIGVDDEGDGASCFGGAAARLTDRVVLPEPPFWLTIAIMVMVISLPVPM
jgi:hypothetical protein